MYSSYKQGLSIVLLTSLLVQSCRNNAPLNLDVPAAVGSERESPTQERRVGRSRPRPLLGQESSEVLQALLALEAQPAGVSPCPAALPTERTPLIIAINRLPNQASGALQHRHPVELATAAQAQASRLLPTSAGSEGPREYKQSDPPKTPRHRPAALTAPVHATHRSMALLGEDQGPTEVESAQREIARLKEAIKEGYGLLLSVEGASADPQIIARLFSDLEQLLGLEALWTLEESDDSAQEYLVRLRDYDRLPLHGADVRERLTALLERAYGQALKRAVSTTLLKGPSNEEQEKLAAALGQLAAFHQAQGGQTGDLSLYTDAAILYQHMLQVCEGEEAKAPGYQEQIKEAYRGLAEIKAAMIARCRQGKATVSSRVSSDELQEEIARDKQILQELRVEAKRRVGELEAAETSNEALYIEKSKALFAEIAQRVGAFLARLYQESEQVLGPPPCKYTVMGLGSMALQQMTPYSDLEFAMLMEESEDAAILAKHRAYFRELSHLVHLRVINLGETVLPQDQYKAQHNLRISLDHLGKRGINFDLGGKTPLGRSDKKYDLIQPVSGMMRYLRNEGHKMEHMDKLLPFILERTCYVHGDQGLHEAYVAQKSTFFAGTQTEQGVPVYQARALQKLLEGVVEMNYSKPGPGLAKPSQGGDLADFAPKFGSEDEGRLYDVKQEIYRLPDRLLCRLAMYYGLLPESGWDAVAQLRAKDIISEEAAPHLAYAVSFATLLRLRTYLHHGQQKEEMAVLSSIRKGTTQEAVSQSFALPAAGLVEGGSLFQYYYTALPLHKRMEEFFNTNEKEEDFFHSQAFYEDDDKIKAMICERLMQHELAKGCYKQAIKRHKARYGAQAHPELADSLNNLGIAYEALGDAKQGLAYYEQALEMHKALYGAQPHPALTAYLNNVGLAYAALGDAKQGLQYKKEALKMFKALYGAQPHLALIAYLNNVGSAYQALGDTKQTLEYQEQALTMHKALYGTQAHPNLARSLGSVGNAYAALGDAKQALEYQEQALEMHKALYGEQAHPNLARSLGNVGSAYYRLGDAKQALPYFEEALEMRQAVYGAQAHPDLARSLGNVGNAYQALGDAKQALAYYEQALEMHKALYGEQAHPDLARSLGNVGSAYHRLGDAKQALPYFEEALEMRQAVYGAQAHPDLARSLGNVGDAYHALGDAKQGLAYYEQALEMHKALYGEQAHPDLARSLNNIGNAYEALGDAKQALAYYEQALEMRQAVYGAQAHPDLARSLGNVGNAYQALGDAKQALAYQVQALEMRQAVYGAQAHPGLASSLNNIGNAYQALGDAKQALAYYEQALAMRQALYGDKPHPDLAMSLNNMGNAYQALGDAKQALAYYEQALAINKALYGAQAHPGLAGSLNNVGLAYAALGDAKQGLTYYEQALEMRQALYGAQAHPGLAMSLNNMGNAYRALGDAKQALAYYEQALAMRQALYGDKLHPDLAGSLNNVGLAYAALGDAKQGLTYYEQALEINKALYGVQAHPGLAGSLNNVGLAHAALGDAKQGLAYYEQALAMYRAMYGAQAHPDLAMSLNNVGNAYTALVDAKQGLAYYKQALAMYRAMYGAQAHPDLAMSLGNVGNAYEALGDAKQALAYYEQALEMHKVLYGEQAHPNLAMSLGNVGSAHHTLGDAKQALPYFEEALAMNQAVYGKQAHPDLARSLGNVGNAYQALGDAKQALAYQVQALEMRQAVYGAQAHPDLAKSLNNLGIAYEALGDTKQALAYYEQALEMYRAVYGAQAHPDLAMSLNNMGNAYAALGDAKQALEYQEQALEMHKALYGEQAHPNLARSLGNVGSAYYRLGDAKQALPYFEEALAIYWAVYGAQAHPDLARSLGNVGSAYESLGEYGKAKQHYEEGLMISNKLPDEAHSYIQILTQSLNRLVIRGYEEALNAYAQHDVAGAIRNYEEILQMVPAASRDTKRSICHNLGCMYHVAALSATEEALRQTYLNKATTVFEQALAWSDGVEADLCTEYGNFLLATAQLAQAHDYLIQAIDSGDTQSELTYGLMEQAMVSPLLQACIDQDKQVEIRGIDYAYYLLIYHYKEFAQAGIRLGQPRDAYLASYGQRIRASAGQPGKEKQDALAHYLLESLHQVLGDE